jgi:hypothetical protein
MSVKIIEVAGQTSLYRQYDRQTYPQPVYVELDCAGRELSATYNGEIGNAVPVPVVFGHYQRFTIPILTADAANSLLRSLAPYAEKVCDGYDSEWDGSNMVATFTDAAQEAINAMSRMCDYIEANEENCVQIIDAATYLEDIMMRINKEGEPCKYDEQPTIVDIKGVGTITGESLSHEIKEIVYKIESELEPNEVIEGLEDFLNDECENCHDSGFIGFEDN